MNENLKKIYTEMYNELKQKGKSFDDIYEEIQDYCSADASRWNLSSDEYGDVFENYSNEMFSFIQKLHNEN